MFRRTVDGFVALVVAATVGMIASAAVGRSQTGKGGAPASAGGACALLAPADIAKATGLTVGNGTASAPIPGTLGRCTWTGGGMKVIVTLADAQHMQLTIAAQEQRGAKAVPGLGSKAVGTEGAAFTGGGYIVSVLDAKGGFGVSILGKDGTRERAVALAKVVESHR